MFDHRANLIDHFDYAKTRLAAFNRGKRKHVPQNLLLLLDHVSASLILSALCCLFFGGLVLKECRASACSTRGKKLHGE
jgi:hypothetical protein